MTSSHKSGRPFWVARTTVAFGLGSAALLTGLAVSFAVGSWHRELFLVPQPVVTIPAGEISFRPGGDFRIGTRAVDTPFRRETVASFAIQQFPVSQAA